MWIQCIQTHLSCIPGIQNGMILATRDLFEQSLAAVQEAILIARAVGIQIELTEFKQRLVEVIETTSRNKNSLLQDLDAGRKTEIDSLCGVIVAKGLEFGIPTPLNCMLVAMIKAKEAAAKK